MKTRLQEFRNRKKESLQDVQNHTGIPRQTLSSYETETREPSIDTIKLLATYYETSIDELLNYNLKEFSENIEQLKNQSFYSLLNTLIESKVWRSLNVYSLDLVLPANSDNNRCVDKEDIPNNWYSSDNEFLGLKIVNDSFLPHFHQGDNVIVEITNTFSEFDIVVLNIDSKTEFCKFFFYKNNPLIQVLRSNLVFDIETPSSKIEIIGRVIQIRRMMNEEILKDTKLIKIENTETGYFVTHSTTTISVKNKSLRKRAYRK
jgi:transcriptional regulator with XRE-family HTH domain